MKQAGHTIHVEASGQGLYEITDAICDWAGRQGISTGLLTIFCRHTSASLSIQENADPDVMRDLNAFFSRLVVEDASLYHHNNEGPDDMPAHIRSALTDVSLSVPVSNARPVLGTWQGIYLFEHKKTPRTRQVVLHLIGQ
ncbi:MAG: secondary thiamine-phosphate synthase enzyme YjbQ [Alphaproteobacteria bacterium]